MCCYNQSINQSKHISIAPFVASESEAQQFTEVVLFSIRIFQSFHTTQDTTVWSDKKGASFSLKKISIIPILSTERCEHRSLKVTSKIYHSRLFFGHHVRSKHRRLHTCLRPVDQTCGNSWWFSHPPNVFWEFPADYKHTLCIKFKGHYTIFTLSNSVMATVGNVHLYSATCVHMLPSAVLSSQNGSAFSLGRNRPSPRSRT